MNYKEFTFSKHVEERIEQRSIELDWIFDTINLPDYINNISEIEVHLFKEIPENNGKILKVIINPLKKLIITTHFDRNFTKNSKL